jgi:hypothetical protein
MRCAQENLGQNSATVHRNYAKYAAVMKPSLDELEKLGAKEDLAVNERMAQRSLVKLRHVMDRVPDLMDRWHPGMLQEEWSNILFQESMSRHPEQKRDWFKQWLKFMLNRTRRELVKADKYIIGPTKPALKA